MSTKKQIHKVGSKYRVTLHYTVEQTFEVGAFDENAAEDEADLLRMLDGWDPDDWDLIHSDIEEIEMIYEDDPEADEWDLQFRDVTAADFKEESVHD